ncbi:MAG: hypothetical protein BEU05_02335 [Marine Group III euryarchaeote CG-Bathy2]|uniref:Uncharacterized protein n=4 Tax=Methanobacteriati TaxID=3366610 RepID=A0A075H1R6_9EURY|nr:hypothetical protein [uncultured marine group II/III euryarchaeote KM3_156_D02]AIF10126.1 hypothetical protein [uncultured marine group II/III euryarchaeote KM3_43_F08]AIF11905.1 hypothetical protein [uncultured marine group II/III euryarchaeote KM3_54_A09]OIR09868.1 MAG: hypothetical protein BEU05_02335 [Marine Group III euryarchaeote CG-Bathy2]
MSDIEELGIRAASLTCLLAGVVLATGSSEYIVPASGRSLATPCAFVFWMLAIIFWVLGTRSENHT